MSGIKYRFYPTLLNNFWSFSQLPNEENQQKLLNRINRVNDFDTETLVKFKLGLSFEDAVLKDSMSDFDQKIIEEVRSLLPKKRVDQYKITFNHKDIQFYGFADVVGVGRVVDIKTTSKYTEGKFKNNFQNLYLYGLKQLGFTEMQYLIYDFHAIHTETYKLADYDFEPMLKSMKDFTDFLNENRSKITDKKIFVSSNTDALNLFS